MTQSKPGAVDRFLNAIETAGNKLPDPVSLFLIFIAITLLLSLVLSLLGLAVTHPVSSETVSVNNLLTAQYIQRLLVEMPQTFAGFPPLGTVLVAMLGIGVAEKSGWISALLRQFVAGLHSRALAPAMVFAGIMSSLAADAGYVVLIPLGALVFANAGRHPIAGLCATFAGVSAGFSANLVLTSLDPLLAGITQSAANILDSGYQVNAAANYFLMIGMVPVLTMAGALVTERVIEPRLGSWASDQREADSGLSDVERKALRIANWTALGALVLIALMAVPENGILRGVDGDLNPFYGSLVSLMLLVFLVPGIAYGVVAGSIKSDRDAVGMTADSMSDMGLYIVLAFVAAHFIALFSWSNLGIIMAISGAQFLGGINLGGPLLILIFILLVGLINLFVGSASAKWALLGPVFVPMLMLLGYSPELSQAAYRVGDSFSNIITPLMPYFPLILVYGRKYMPEFGVGNLIALMLPYSIALGIASTTLLVIWMLIGMPLGPEAGLYFEMPASAVP